MTIKLFVLGRPGCGKSKTTQYVVELVELEGWTTSRFQDYSILEEMSQKDVSKKKFRPSKHGGFDVLDKDVFNDALLELEKRVYNHPISIEKRVFITIEFAREDYDEAFKQFSPNFLRDAYFLFINTDFEKCKQRIHKRIIQPVTADDHFISDYALDTYYVNQYPPQDEDIMKRLTVIENQGLWGDTIKEINSIVQQILLKH